MQKALLQTLAFLLAHAPEWLLRGLAAAFGDLIYFGLPRRRRIVLANLGHAFPERSPEWRRRTGRASCRRLAETALFSLALPALPERRLRRMVAGTPSLEAFLRDYAARPRATVFGTAHFAHWESQTCLRLLCPGGALPEFGIIYRPLDRPATDAWIRRARERFGMKLLSRKDGFQEALRILRRAGCVGVLFDQNAGLQGALTLLCGRVAATTELPGLLAEKFAADLRVFYPRRTAFWRVEFAVEPVAHDGTAAGATLALNRWLEQALAGDDELCASWLWSHQRWKTQDFPAQRLRLSAKRNLLAEDLRARGLAELPRRTRIWVRLPNWLGDVVMALPLLRALRASRPDAEITLVGKGQFLPLLADWGVADRLEPLPRRGFGYFAHFWRLRRAFPDIWLLFTHSMRGDLEAWLARSPQRFGLVRPGRRRPLLTHAYAAPAAFDAARNHQVLLWENFLRHFGLATPPDFQPITSRATPTHDIGLICGSENTPAKRWPVAHWRELIAALPEQRFVLFGTPGDRAITASVAVGFGDRARDLAGRTSLPEFAAQLRSCRLLVTNDTGGMHLANALGVPLIALFGPTNPLRTGPVFAAPTKILQPPGCAPAGGGALATLAPAAVIAAIKEFPDSAPRRD